MFSLLWVALGLWGLGRTGREFESWLDLTVYKILHRAEVVTDSNQRTASLLDVFVRLISRSPQTAQPAGHHGVLDTTVPTD